MLSEEQRLKYANDVILFLAKPENKEKEFGYDDLVIQLDIPSEYRGHVLNHLWSTRIRHINGQPTLKNPKISINEQGLKYADELEQEHFEKTGSLFSQTPNLLFPSINEACDYILKQHQNSTDNSITWTRTVTRTMPINYVAALESLRDNKIIHERFRGTSRTTYLNADVEHAKNYLEAKKIIEEKNKQIASITNTTHGPNSPIAGKDVKQKFNDKPEKKNFFERIIDDIRNAVVSHIIVGALSLITGGVIGIKWLSPNPNQEPSQQGPKSNNETVSPNKGTVKIPIDSTDTTKK
jgi:hypothetical protein